MPTTPTNQPRTRSVTSKLMAACIAAHSEASLSTQTPDTANPPKIIRIKHVKTAKGTAAELLTLGAPPTTSAASTARVTESANATAATDTTGSMLPTTPFQFERMASPSSASPPPSPASTVAVEEWLETTHHDTAVETVVAVELPAPEEDRGLSKHRVARHKAKTVIIVNGYPFTGYHTSGIKRSYRCSSFRTSHCKVKVHFIVAANRYNLVGEHTCKTRIDPESPAIDVSADMRNTTDRMAVTDMSMPPEEIWSAVRAQFYLASTDEVLLGLTREQVKRRVHRVRRSHFGGNYHGVVEVPPLPLTSVGCLPFFKFHQVYMDDTKLERFIGWAHPALHERLKCKSSSLFIDGTFRCVPRGFYQCIIFMVHDFATDLFLPVFFVLCTSKTQDMYWNVINAVVVACNEKLLPETVVCDFESALIDAVSVQFKDARVVGCYFHFKQACKRYLETKVMLASDAVKIAMTPGFLDLLTVIPQRKINGPGIRYVTKKIEQRCLETSVVYSSTKWEKFWRYFRKTWIRKYRPQDWNVYDIEKPLVSRTNNPLERFNREINAVIGSPHPSLPRFVSAIDGLSVRYAQRLEDTSKMRSAKRYRRTPDSCYLPDEIDLSSDDEDAVNNGEEDIASSADESELSDVDIRSEEDSIDI